MSETQSKSVTSPARFRAWFGPVVALATLFAVGLGAGFLYAHEPAPPEFRVVVEPAPAPGEGRLRGTISAVGADYLEIATTAGIQRLQMPAGTPVEELVRLTGAVAQGARVNVGGNRTENGFVITGVVVLEDGR